ncbi:hypothetical protein QLR68_24590 [Micromonospora sp. DH15]|nr:hypothetical protein [Micromonospora sp. DH15]
MSTEPPRGTCVLSLAILGSTSPRGKVMRMKATSTSTPMAIAGTGNQTSPRTAATQVTSRARTWASSCCTTGSNRAGSRYATATPAGSTTSGRRPTTPMVNACRTGGPAMSRRGRLRPVSPLSSQSTANRSAAPGTANRPRCRRSRHWSTAGTSSSNRAAPASTTPTAPSMTNPRSRAGPAMQSVNPGGTGFVAVAPYASSHSAKAAAQGRLHARLARKSRSPALIPTATSAATTSRYSQPSRYGVPPSPS